MVFRLQGVEREGCMHQNDNTTRSKLNLEGNATSLRKTHKVKKIARILMEVL